MADEINGFFAETNGESVATALDDRVQIHLVPKTEVNDTICVQKYVYLCGLKATVNDECTRITIW